MTTRVIIHVKKIQQDGISVYSIKAAEDQTTYKFPKEFRDEKSHQEILALSASKAAIKGMSKSGNFRNIKLTWTPEIKSLYMDKDENFIFKGCLLEEVNNESINTPKNSEIEVDENINALHNIEKKFNLEIFYGRDQDASEWINSFEKECIRNNIINHRLKIQALKYFLNGTPKNWYDLNIKKFEHDAWPEWVSSFLLVFTKRGWSQIRYAYKYEHINGSFVDYAIKKEKLLIDADFEMPEKTRINHIVIGLPIKIQNQLERLEIKRTDYLISFLQKLDSENSYINKTNIKENSHALEKRKSDYKQIEKKPCFKCEKLGKPNRYHPINLCFNKKRYAEIAETLLNENIIENKTESGEEKN